MSRLLIKDTGTPDGVYEADIYNDTTKIIISTVDVTFLDDVGIVDLVGEAAVVKTLIAVKGANQPETGFVKFLSSEVTAPPEAIVTFSEVNQPITKGLEHDLADSVVALFVVDEATGVVKDLISGSTQSVTTAVTGVDELDSFKEQATFNSLFTLSTFDNLTVMAFGDLRAMSSTETIVELVATNTAYLRLRTDDHWDVTGFSQIENGFAQIGSAESSSHEGLTSLAFTVGVETVRLLNDGVTVASAANSLQDIGSMDDPITIKVGGVLSNTRLIVVLNRELAANQIAVLHSDVLNFLDNTGNGLSIPAGGSGGGGGEGGLPVPTVVFTPRSPDGIYRTDARKAAIVASDTNSTEFYDDLNSRLIANNYVYGDFTAWYIQDLCNRVKALMDAYQTNGDVDYLTQAKNAFYYRYVTTKWESVNDTYTGRNSFRAEGKTALVLATQLAPHFTADENAAVQVELLKWANYWLTFMKYESSFSGTDWKDTDETASLCESFLVFALALDDTETADKCLATFEYIYAEIEDYLINGVCSDGFWCEGTAYNANTAKNYLRMRILANDHTDLPNQQGFVFKLWDAYVHQYFNLDSPHIWWHGDIEGDNPLDCDQEESRYISFYDTIIELLKGDPREAQCAYFRSLINDSTISYTGSDRYNFQDSRVAGVRPSSLPLYHEGLTGMRMQVMRDTWEADNTVGIMSNHAFFVDHNHMSPLNFDLYYKAKAVTKQLTAYALKPPFNGCYLEGHGNNTQATQAYIYGEPVQYNTVSNGTYAYTCGDTKDTFNQKGWDKHIICSQFSRAIFIDYASRTVLTYDRIVTDPYVNLDMDSEPATPWARKVERHHRFMHKTVAPTLLNGIYSGEYNGIVQHYEPLLPVDSIEILEEITHPDYSEQNAAILPRGQVAHQVREHIQSSDAELMSLLTYGETGQVAATHEPVTVSAGNVIGTMVNSSNVVLFNRQPQLPFTGTIEFTVADASLIGSIYVLGVDSALSYDKTVVGNTVTLSSGGATAVDTSSVLVI